MARTSTKSKSTKEEKATVEVAKTDEIKHEETVAIRADNANEAAIEGKNAEAEIALVIAGESKVTDRRDEQIEALKAQIEQLKQLVAQQAAQPPQQIVVSTDNSERVWFLWMADVADDNVTLIGEHGEYGRIVGKVGTFYVPKNDLSRILDTANRYYLEQRWMIVVDGLTDEEREALGVDYKEGELLDRKAFMKITELGDTLLEIFPALCTSHKDMVASRFHEAYESGKKLYRPLIVELNKIYNSPAFVDIIERMNAEELGQN